MDKMLNLRLYSKVIVVVIMLEVAWLASVNC